ncbi:hypothetical protein GTN66_00030 [bacterium]|nr:hypothetical protein [bacterium]NIN91409.1 hypothetical protein [bacterium]NIO17819.1 hypothetical protein [bacterium]NIO72800.1 hypothetical protein [bacterium]
MNIILIVPMLTSATLARKISSGIKPSLKNSELKKDGLSIEIYSRRGALSFFPPAWV